MHSASVVPKSQKLQLSDPALLFQRLTGNLVPLRSCYSELWEERDIKNSSFRDEKLIFPSVRLEFLMPSRPDTCGRDSESFVCRCSAVGPPLLCFPRSAGGLLPDKPLRSSKFPRRS